MVRIGAQNDANIVDNMVTLTIVQLIGVFQNAGSLFSLVRDERVCPKGTR